MAIELVLSLLAGSVLGLMFFGGLWWTIRKAIAADNPALWFFASALLRLSIALTGFYFIMDGDWHRLLAALFGFVIVRMILTRFKPLFNQNSENKHAT
ncbi:MAG: ATP synthase subunit I [Gammaproteobacteria bacterium]|nr:ATP synthase subunit I [Gammaproteobacteria bacterium]